MSTNRRPETSSYLVDMINTVNRSKQPYDNSLKLLEQCLKDLKELRQINDEEFLIDENTIGNDYNKSEKDEESNKINLLRYEDNFKDLASSYLNTEKLLLHTNFLTSSLSDVINQFKHNTHNHTYNNDEDLLQSILNSVENSIVKNEPGTSNTKGSDKKTNFDIESSDLINSENFVKNIESQIKEKENGLNEKDFLFERYNQYKNQILNESNENENDELAVIGSHETYKDPFTQDWLNNPVRSKTCGHVFSNESISQAISRSGGMTSCPVFGCSSEINKRDLIIDPVLARKSLKAKIVYQKQRIADFENI